MTIFKKLSIAAGLVIFGIVSTSVAQIVINPPVSNITINGHTYTNAMLQSNPAGWLGGIANDIAIVTAGVGYPAGPVSPRIRLTANLDMYVDAAAGDDSRNCLVGNTCRTVQKPFDRLRDEYDLAGYSVTIHLADGSYSPGFKLSGKLLGQFGPENLILVGNEASPQNVIISDTSTPASNQLDSGTGVPVFVQLGGTISVRGVTLISGYRNAWAHHGGFLWMRKVRFGPCNSIGQSHVWSDTASMVRFNGDYEIYAGCGSHYSATQFGVIYASDPSAGTVVHLTITGSPTFDNFASAEENGLVEATAGTIQFSGSIIGLRYWVSGNSTIRSNNGGENFFPGNSAGHIQLGGLYY